MNSSLRVAALATLLTISGAAMAQTSTKALRVCADPGNMPLSNIRGEGFQNKIAEILAASMGTHVTYYWRPSIERGMFRSTLDADECDVYLDMPTDTERVLTTVPLYRTSFVLAYRDDKGYDFKGLDDPRLKQLRIGVFQMSAIRQALAQHGVKEGVVLHFISHDGDLVPEHQPSHQVQQVIDGTLDVAAIWGPMAGYYKTVKKAPITIQPVNLVEHLWPMEYDLSLAVRKRDTGLKDRLEEALKKEQGRIRQILADYGVPLVECRNCVISGDLPSHGPYQKTTTHNMISEAEEREVPAAERTVTLEKVDTWLADGASLNQELNNAVIAGDMARAEHLLAKGADIDARDAQGYPPLVNAARRTDGNAVKFLLDHGADANGTDTDGWNALQFAAWRDQPEIIRMLLAKVADIEARTPSGLTPLALASQHGRSAAVAALVGGGANVNVAIGQGGYTPLMLAVAGGSVDIVDLLVKKGAEVNAANAGGITPLMIAAAGNFAETAEVLIKAGANVNTKSEDGRTALSIAREKDSEAVLRVLEDQELQTRSDRGADVAPHA
jgi:quinoprotein dehydrogenase-associated probable ABC transporter substrate-binding protein